MHELSVATELIKAVERETQKAGASGRVLSVRISLGRLSCISAESLRFCFELIAPGTGAANAQLIIEEPPATGVCRSCGAREAVLTLFDLCPVCGGDDLEIEGSRDALLLSIETED